MQAMPFYFDTPRRATRSNSSSAKHRTQTWVSCLVDIVPNWCVEWEWNEAVSTAGLVP